MLLTLIGLVKFSVVFVFSVSNTTYHILCSSVCGCEDNKPPIDLGDDDIGTYIFS